MSKSPQAPTYRVPGLALIGLVLVGLLITIFAWPPSSRATRVPPQNSKSANGKGQGPAFAPGHVLVRFKDEATAKRQQQTMTFLSLKERSIAVQLERFDSAGMIDGLRLAHVASGETMNAIQTLKARSDVLYAEPDFIMHVDTVPVPNDPCFPVNSLPSCQPTVPPNQIQPTSLYGLNKIGAPTAWNTTTGSSSVVVGVIDEGIDINHPDLHNNIWVNPSPGAIPGFSGDINGWDFFHNDASVFDNTGGYPADQTDAHGTHVAGTLGAVGNNNLGVVGVNWNVRLMSLKVFAPDGLGSDAIRAMSYAKAQRDLFVKSGGAQGANVRVLNNSWGGVSYMHALLDAINALNQSAILFVASAGNDGNNIDTMPQYPASYKAPNVIAVAWTDANDNLFPLSNFGQQSVALGAPGNVILSTTPNSTYDTFSGTSMASPHVAGAAALLLAQNPNLTVAQLRSLLLFNGDAVPALNGKTFSGRRLNVGNSFAALAANDTIAPGMVTNFHVNSQAGRTFDLGWTASGDDGASGQASLYQVSYNDAVTGALVLLRNVAPPASGTPQTLTVTVPYGHTDGTITLREFDKVGNEGTPATVNAPISFADGNPYAVAVGKTVALSTGGTPLGLPFDDCYKTNYGLPFAFPYFGQSFSTITISTNGSLYFSSPPVHSGETCATDSQGGTADDIPSSERQLPGFERSGVTIPARTIAGMWDDLDLRVSRRAGSDVYVVMPDANRIIFRWQGVQFVDGGDVNFEIELRSNGLIQFRYGSGNANLMPVVVGISNADIEPYLITSHTSEETPINLTNAPQVTFVPRAAMNPMDFADFFVSQHYRDFLAREPDPGGEAFWIDQIAGNATNTPPPCAPGDTNCLNTRRINVSNAFFFELEYQQTAAYVYRVYREAFGNSQPFPNPDGSNQTEANKIPLYSKFKADREQVIGGADLASQQLAFANAFVQRPEFTNKYPANQTLAQFVDAILLTIKNELGADLTSQTAALNGLGSKGAVLYRLANDDLQGGNGGINNLTFIDAEYNRAFVFGEYAGYLRRDADIGGFLFWLNQVNSGPLRDLTKQRAMVCSFIDSAEYQFRFSTIESHHTSECQ